MGFVVTLVIAYFTHGTGHLAAVFIGGFVAGLLARGIFKGSVADFWQTFSVS